MAKCKLNCRARGKKPRQRYSWINVFSLVATRKPLVVHVTLYKFCRAWDMGLVGNCPKWLDPYRHRIVGLHDDDRYESKIKEIDPTDEYNWPFLFFEEKMDILAIKLANIFCIDEIEINWD